MHLFIFTDPPRVGVWPTRGGSGAESGAPGGLCCGASWERQSPGRHPGRCARRSPGSRAGPSGCGMDSWGSSWSWQGYHGRARLPHWRRRRRPPGCPRWTTRRPPPRRRAQPRASADSPLGSSSGCARMSTLANGLSRERLQTDLVSRSPARDPAESSSPGARLRERPQLGEERVSVRRSGLPPRSGIAGARPRGRTIVTRTRCR